MRLIAPLSLCLLLATSAFATLPAERPVVVELYQSPVSYTHLTLPTIYSV